MKKQNTLMMRLANFIVDKRNLIFFLYILLIIFSAFSSSWVRVENDLTAYLPPESMTKQGLLLMEEEFVTFGTNQIMVESISYDEAERLAERIRQTEGVQSVVFSDTAEHYKNASAEYDVTYDYDQSDDRCLKTQETVMELLHGYDVYYTSSFEDTLQQTIEEEMRKIIVFVAVIVVGVLLLTSSTYGEILVLLLTFISAAVVNTGTNFLLGEISFVSDSVTIVLQLALSLDYAVIFCNRYKEEHQTLPVREAAVVALAKAIPEIGASSLTTVGGLLAMMFMQFKIGTDMAICLIKAIVVSLMSVFLLMPGLLVLFGKLMDRTGHRNFVPNISVVGKFAYRTRYLVPPLFAATVVAAYILSGNCSYVYGYGELVTPQKNTTQIAEEKISDTFGDQNMVALVLPSGDYNKERRLLDELDGMKEVESTIGLSNTEAMGGYMLTDKLTPRQFSELVDMDYETSELLYVAYAADLEYYGKIVGGISGYSVPLMDMIAFAYEEVEEGYATLDDELTDTLEDACGQIENGKKQLQSQQYSRALIYLTLPEGGAETYAFLDTIQETARKYYPDQEIFVVGNSSNEYEFEKTFSKDNVIISFGSILIVLVVLLFTFKSVGLPVLLIVVIEGCIWMNFSIPTLTGSGVFFMSYLVVSAIQMGANIDYAIVISSRFMEIKNSMPRKQAMMDTLNFAFPTILTSGSMMALAGFLIGSMTSEASIAGIGQSLGRGTLISIGVVLFVLPQLLLLGEKVIDRTSFDIHTPISIMKKEEEANENEET